MVKSAVTDLIQCYPGFGKDQNYTFHRSGLQMPAPPHHPPSRLLDCMPSSLHHYCQITCHFKGGQDVRGEILAARRRGVWARCTDPSTAKFVQIPARRRGPCARCCAALELSDSESWKSRNLGRGPPPLLLAPLVVPGPSQLRPLTFREF